MFVTSKSVILRLVAVIPRNNSQPHSLDSSDENWKRHLYPCLYISKASLSKAQCHVESSTRLCYAYVLISSQLLHLLLRPKYAIGRAYDAT